MAGSNLRGYVAIFLIVGVLSTSLVAITWIWRERGLRTLSLSGPDYLFKAAQGTATISITVTPETELDALEFRFRCLVERDMSELSLRTLRASSTEDLADAWPTVRDRLRYFETIGAREHVAIHDVSATNQEARVVLFDFGKIYSCLFDDEHDNESLTTYAFLLNSTNHIVGCFEGYSDYLVARELKGELLRRDEVLKLVGVQSGDIVNEFYGREGAEPSTQSLPSWGHISFEKVRVDEPYGVTLIAKEANMAPGRLLLCVETFGDGIWYPDSSGYWIARTELV
jgi:hypothetical protein